jgi:hypothetical protein
MEDVAEGGITTPIGSVNFKGKRMAEFIAIFCLASLMLLGYVMWEHKEDAKGMKDAFKDGFREMASAQREQNAIQREQLCLLSLPESRRQQEFLNDSSFCKRLSRER